MDNYDDWVKEKGNDLDAMHTSEERISAKEYADKFRVTNRKGQKN